jgi:hypothetical protein
MNFAPCECHPKRADGLVRIQRKNFTEDDNMRMHSYESLLSKTSPPFVPFSFPPTAGEEDKGEVLKDTERLTLNITFSERT